MYADLQGFSNWIDANIAQELHDQFKKAALALEAKKAYEADLKDYNDKAEVLAAQQTKVDNLLAARNASQVALYGETSGNPSDKPSVLDESNPTESEINVMASGSLYRDYMDAVKKQNDAQTAYDAAAGDASSVAGNNDAAGKALQLTAANAEVVRTTGFLNELNFYEQNFNKSHKYQQYFYSGIITRKYITDFNSF